MKTFTEWEETTDGFSESEKGLMELAWNASEENSAAEISRLKALLRKCFAALSQCKEWEESIATLNTYNYAEVQEALAAIKGEGL